MRLKRREPVTIVADTARLPAVPVRAILRADIGVKRIWASAVGATILVIFAVLGAVNSAEVKSLAHPFATNRFSGADTAKEPDPIPSIEELRREAQAGNPEAEFQLGVRYAKGEEVELNYESAARWFQAAAGHGIARAQFDMGVLYEHGRGVPINVAKAADWYLQAAEGGYPLAEYNLAVFYARGLGVGQDVTRAAFWYRRAAMQGVVQAMVNLAAIYDKGGGIPGDPVNAYAWYLTAAASGNQTAQQRVVEMAALLPPPDQARAKLLANDIAAAIEPRLDKAGIATNLGQSDQ